jgi:hypothetical protein
MNLKHGKGVYTWPDGRVFEGTWDQGMRKGIGTITATDGKKRKGVWD